MIFKKKNKINLSNIPEHIAIIMDGNGRWAKKRGLPRTKGHEEGAKRVEELVLNAKELGIKVLTLFAFSTENWKRPKEEVDYIFSLLEKFLKEGKKQFKDNDIKIHFIGKINDLEDKFVKLINEAMEETKNNESIILNIAVNYGGRNEIVEATKSIAKECVDGNQDVEKIDEIVFNNHLMTNFLPEVDLLVRTSGEVRVSNFLLWQIAYSEFVFTKCLWSDFNKDELIKVILEYQSRKRRYGGL